MALLEKRKEKLKQEGMFDVSGKSLYPICGCYWRHNFFIRAVKGYTTAERSFLKRGFSLACFGSRR